MQYCNGVILVCMQYFFLHIQYYLHVPSEAYYKDFIMKFLLVLSAILAFVAAETYSPDNDDLDIEKVVGDADTLKAFLDCFNDKGACDERSADFKKDLPEAIAQACAKCTTAQKHIFKRFLEVIKVQKPEEYKLFGQKYDPQNKYLTALEAAIAKF